MKRHGAAVLTAAVALSFLGGCQTTQSSDDDVVRPSAQILFIPRLRQAPIQAGEGRYPNLFTGASHAVWDPVAEAAPIMPVSAAGSKSDNAEAAMDADIERVEPAPMAHAARAGGLTIECFLESEFPDMSTAYDAVGLRGMAVGLKLPDGREVQPAQKRLDADLRETQVGALRRYSRKLTLYFPDGNFLVENPALNPAAAGIRLVLTGHDSMFFFEWPATPDLLATPKPRLDQEAAATARKHLRSTRDAVQRTSHNFD